MKKKVTTLNEEAKERIKVIEFLQTPEGTFAEAGRLFGIHKTTASEWWKIYQEEGIEGLKRARKPRPVYDINTKELKALRPKVSQADQEKIDMLIDLVNMGIVKAAKKWNWSPQGLGKIRKKYVDGQWPVTVTV